MTERTPFNRPSDDSPESNGRIFDAFACSKRLADLASAATSTANADELEFEAPESARRRSEEASDWPTHPEIIELITAMLAGSPSLTPAKEISNCKQIHSVYLPEHYEAGYAYPLVIWFHREGGSEADLQRVMPQISDRNYIGVALRGNKKHKKGFGWNLDKESLASLVEDVRAVAVSMRRTYHIHSERIYLAGFGAGANAAMEVMLRQPEWFGGVLSLNGDFSKIDQMPEQLQELKDKRILLATSVECMKTKLGDVVATGRLLYAAGMQVGTRVYQDADKSPSKKMLRDIDSWLMDEICATASGMSI